MNIILFRQIPVVGVSPTTCKVYFPWAYWLVKTPTTGKNSDVSIGRFQLSLE